MRIQPSRGEVVAGRLGRQPNWYNRQLTLRVATWEAWSKRGQQPLGKARFLLRSVARVARPRGGNASQTTKSTAGMRRSATESGSSGFPGSHSQPNRLRRRVMFAERPKRVVNPHVLAQSRARAEETRKAEQQRSLQANLSAEGVARWEQKTDAKIEQRLVRERAQTLRRESQRRLDSRRAKLAEMFRQEQHQFEQEIEASEETPEERRQRCAAAENLGCGQVAGRGGRLAGGGARRLPKAVARPAARGFREPRPLTRRPRGPASAGWLSVRVRSLRSGRRSGRRWCSGCGSSRSGSAATTFACATASTSRCGPLGSGRSSCARRKRSRRRRRGGSASSPRNGRARSGSGTRRRSARRASRRRRRPRSRTCSTAR